MKFVNEHKEHVVKIPRWGIECKPGEQCEVPDCYSWPDRASNGSRLPSVVEMLAPQLKPADKATREAWSKVPLPKVPTLAQQVPSVQELIKQGLPPGVAEAEHKKALAVKLGAGKSSRE